MHTASLVTASSCFCLETGVDVCAAYQAVGCPVHTLPVLNALRQSGSVCSALAQLRDWVSNTLGDCSAVRACPAPLCAQASCKQCECLHSCFWPTLPTELYPADGWFKKKCPPASLTSLSVNSKGEWGWRKEKPATFFFPRLPWALQLFISGPLAGSIWLLRGVLWLLLPPSLTSGSLTQSVLLDIVPFQMQAPEDLQFCLWSDKYCQFSSNLLGLE